MPVLSRSKVRFLTRQTAVRKVVNRLVGFEDKDKPKGFLWDQRHVSLAKNAETLPFPGIKKSHLNGVPRSYFQNGPLLGEFSKDIKVIKVKREFRSGTEHWVPVVRKGNFIIWRDKDILFSDNSVVEYLSTTALDVNSRSYHTLAREYKNGTPIRATIYKRSTDNENQVWKEYHHRYKFTGTLDTDGSRKTTRDGDTITWANVDTNKKEFITFIREERLFLQFNQNAAVSVTSTTTPTDILDFNEKEHVGISDGTANQVFETKIFPIASTDLHVYVVDATNGTWTEYTVVTSFTGANQVIVDREIGTLIFGTTALGSVPDVLDDIYLSYKAIPRIEYEEVGYDDYKTGYDANVNPLGQSLNKGFVVLSRSELDIATITLETNKAKYKNYFDTFGPIYAGADHAQLIATVYSSTGKPVPNVEVKFEMEYEPAVGSIGNSGVSAEYRTRANGQAKTFYTTPNSADEMGYYVTNLTSSTQLEVRSDANFTTVNDIYTYYVLKDDPWLGKVGADTSLGEVEWDPQSLNGRKTILYKWDATAINPITGIIGAYAPVVPTTITSGNLLTYADTLETPDSSDTVGSDNLGAYWIVSDRTISIQASAYSERFKRRIYSNTIKLRVELPPYMKGVYINDALQRIPFGYRVPDSSYTVASALGGATFICINPIAGPYNIVDVIAGETLTWDTPDPFMDYVYIYPTPDASRPFGYLTFSFTIA